MKKGRQIALQLLVLLLGLIFACAVICLCSKEPATAIRYFFTGPFSSAYYIGNLISYSIPLIITGLASSVAFSASMWNLGIEGQMFFGMLCGTWVAWRLSDWPAAAAVPLALVCSFLGGAFIAWISNALLKYFHVNIMMSSMLIGNALMYIVMYFLEGPFNDPGSGSGTCSPKLNTSFLFPKILGTSDLHAGLFLALALTVFITIALKRQKKGYEISITGKNPRFAQYGGINAAAVVAFAMLLSGGLAGLGGMVDILGVHGKMRSMMTGFGWDGVSIAMIARNEPLMIVPVALFFAFLQKGAESASLFSDISPDIAALIQASVLFLATSEVIYDLFKRRRRDAKPENSGKEAVVK